MDNFQTRAIKNLQGRHAVQIRENAERIQEYIGYVIKRLDVGRPDSVGHYAEDLEASARRIIAHVAALEAIGDAVGILETGDDTSPEI